MKHYQDEIRNQTTGLLIENATVTVRLAGTMTLANLYATNSTSGPTISNPFSPPGGRLQFYVPDGSYDIAVTTQYNTTTETDVEIFDQNELAAKFGYVDSAVGATGADRIQTGADRTQTGVDRAATVANAAALQVARSGAEAARDAAAVSAGSYASEAIGRAAVADGVRFAVTAPGAAAITIYQRVNAGTVSTLINQYPSLSAVAVIPAKLAQQAFGTPQRNLFQGYTLGYQIDGSTGALVAASGYYASDFISVAAFAQVSASRFGPNLTIAAYDATGVFLGIVGGAAGGSQTDQIDPDGSGTTVGSTVTLPGGVAAQIRISGLAYEDLAADGSSQPRLSYPAQQLILPGNAVQPKFTNSAPALVKARPISAADLSPWAGRTVAVQGDSKSSYQYGDQRWLQQVGARLGFKVVTFARAGRTMADALKRPDNTAMVQADLTPLDALYLDLGINDFLNAVPIGALTDATTSQTFYGQTRKAIEQYITWKPTIRLAINTPTRINFNGLSDPAAYRAALIACADYYSIAVNDLSRTSGDNALTINSRTIDPGLHHTPAGLLAAKVNPTEMFMRGVWSPGN